MYRRRQDIWAVGVTIYQVLTSKHPFPAEDLASLKQMLITDKMKIDYNLEVYGITEAENADFLDLLNNMLCID